MEFVFDDEEIKDYKFSGFIPRYESITNLFEILEQSANVSFVRKEDKTLIQAWPAKLIIGVSYNKF